MEHNAIELKEYASLRNYPAILWDIVFGYFIRSYTDGYIGVTDEITNYQLKRSGDSSKPHITIGNGIVVDSVPLRCPNGFLGDELNLLCVSNINRWHGFDRLLKGLIDYKGNTKEGFEKLINRNVYILLIS